MYKVTIDLDIASENLVATNSETLNDTTFLDDAWIRQRTHPTWLGNCHQKISRSLLWNRHRHCFPSWHSVLSVHTVPVKSVIVTENWVAEDSEIITETPFTADPWIALRTQSRLTRKSTSKTESLMRLKSSPKMLPQLMLGFVYVHCPCWLSNHHRILSSWRLRNNQRVCLQCWRVDSSAQIYPVDCEIASQNLVAAESETINETASTGEAWIRPRTQSLLIENHQWVAHVSKSSPKLLPQLTLGFISAHSPCWLGNRHHQLSRWRLRNHHRNCLHYWRLDWSVHTVPVESEIDTENWVAHASEIFSKTASPDEAWIRRCAQSLSTR
jgi:hypothetical protein